MDHPFMKIHLCCCVVCDFALKFRNAPFLMKTTLLLDTIAIEIASPSAAFRSYLRHILLFYIEEVIINEYFIIALHTLPDVADEKHSLFTKAQPRNLPLCYDL